MKLISCHIENFGKLRNEDFDFKEGLTVFTQENGAGKTTLAAFIKAMFYGLAPYKSNTKVFCDRQRYYPFGGGKFGGNLTFEKGGDIYRVERFFDKKSDVKDELNIYKNNAPVKNIKDFGGEILGLDEQSFTRTAFITADDIDGGATSDIGEKITGRVFEADGAGVDDAVSILEKKRKTLKAARGAGGEIDRLKEERRQVLNEIAELEDIDVALGGYYRDRKELAGEISELTKSVEKLNEDRLVYEKQTVLDGYERELKEKEEEFSALSEKYAKGIPSEEEINIAEENYKTFIKNQSALSSTAFTKEERLKELEEKFKDGAPQEEIFVKCGGLLDTAAKLKAEAEQIKGSAESKKAEKLADVFRHGLPDEEGLESAKAVSERYKANDLKLKTPALNALVRGKNTPYIIAGAASAALLVAGIALIFFVLIAGIILLSLGGAGLIICGVMYFTLNKKTAGADTSSLVQALAADEQILRSYLAPYGYYSDSVISAFSQFLSDLADYKLILEEKEERAQTLNQKISGVEEAEKEAYEILKAYGFEEENARGGLDSLKEQSSEYKLLASEKAAAEEKIKTLESENGEILQSIRKTLEKYGISSDGENKLREISDDIKNYARLEKEVKEKQLKAQSYKQENNLFERVELKEDDLDGVRESLDKKRKELGILDSRISDCEASLERLPEKRAKRQEIEGRIEKDTRAVKILSAAEELLKEAHKKLCDKYVSPVKDSFLKYSDGIEKALGEKLIMTADFEVSFEFGGEIKSRKHLSAGQLAVCGLCLRFALLENVFKTDKPFVIMDDPFVNLDEENMKNTAKVIKELKNIQIIYFCCHDSRAI